MEIKNEIKSLIAKNATTLKAVSIDLKNITKKNISPNNITKLRRNTIKFSEVQDILNILGYSIEMVKNK